MYWLGSVKYRLNLTKIENRLNRYLTDLTDNVSF